MHPVKQKQGAFVCLEHKWMTYKTLIDFCCLYDIVTYCIKAVIKTQPFLAVSSEGRLGVHFDLPAFP